MMQAIRSYLLSVVAVGFLVCLATAIVPKGTLKKLVVFTGGLIVILVVAAPVVNLDFDAAAGTLDEFDILAAEPAVNANLNSQDLLCELINEKTESYILDKAQTLGMQLTVQVELMEDAQAPYPYAVTLRGTYTQAQKDQLSSDLETSLAIPKERQAWYSCEEP